jgi:hypothetical protein
MARPTLWPALVAALSLALLLGVAVACGGGSDDTTGETDAAATSTGDGGSGTPGPTGAPSGGNTDVASGVEACDLLTKAEVEEALGEAATEPQAGASGPYETCTWNTQEVALKFVILQVHSGVSREEFLTQKDQTAAFLDEDVTDVEGLGDAAYDLGGFLYAHQGNFELVMTNILGFNVDDPAEAAQALEVNRGLMEKALGRLP